jgi:probable phosphoglycerate mutase
MCQSIAEIYPDRHGGTAWTISHQHTGVSNISLTERGERKARSVGDHLRGATFTKMLVSRLERARQTAAPARFADLGAIEPELMECDHGRYEGLTSAELRKKRPEWSLSRHGCPEGECVPAVEARADRVTAKLREGAGRLSLLGDSHFFHVQAAGWIGLAAADGRRCFLSTASLSVMGYEHSVSQPAVRLWNDVRHVTN